MTRPKVSVTVACPESANVGDEVPFQILVSNAGTGVAEKLTLHVELSKGVTHPQGSPLAAELPRLAPGESRTVTLKAMAAAPGTATCSLVVSAEGMAEVTQKGSVLVQQPKLALIVKGPAKALVRAEPTFTLELTNPGTSATGPVQAAAAFPEGLEFVSASEGGNYEPGTRTVTWNLQAVPVGGKREVTVKLRAGSAGNLAVRAVAQSGRLDARGESVVAVEGVPALSFEVVNLENPIEVGKEATYEIRLVNTGSCPMSNVRLSAVLTDGLTLTAVSPGAAYKAAGQTLTFDPVARLAVKADLVIRIKAKGTTAGDLRCKVQLACDQLKSPVVKEECTSFYAN